MGLRSCQFVPSSPPISAARTPMVQPTGKASAKPALLAEPGVPSGALKAATVDGAAPESLLPQGARQNRSVARLMRSVLQQTVLFMWRLLIFVPKALYALWSGLVAGRRHHDGAAARGTKQDTNAAPPGQQAQDHFGRVLAGPSHDVKSGTVQGRGSQQALQPHETIFAPVMLGRNGTNVARSTRDRPAFAAASIAKSSLRTSGGRVTDRLLAHAFSLPDKYLDGSLSSEALRELAEQAHRFVEGARPGAQQAQRQVAALMPLLVQAMRWHDLCDQGYNQRAEAHQQMVAALAAEGRILLPLNFCGSTRREITGHATMLYIVREQAGTLALRLYNTGAGISNHVRRQTPEGRRQAQTRWEVQGVSQTAFARPADFERLFALGRRASLALKTNINAVYRYLEQLGRRPTADAPWHKPQTVGNCTWKATTSFLKDNLDERSYRTFKTYFRSRILFEAIEQMTPEGATPGAAPATPFMGETTTAMPGNRLGKLQLFAAADAKCRRDLARLNALDSDHATQLDTEPPAERPKSQKKRAWFGAKTQKNQASLPRFLTTAYVHTVRKEVNAYASELLARRLQDG